MRNPPPGPDRCREASLTLVATAFLNLVLILAACSPPADRSRTALQQGNRLVRSGELTAALEAYSAGYDPAAPPSGVLAYNLGTTAHRLGRLPEAVLWYRRAARWIPADPWLEDNLARAREALGTEPPPPPSHLATLAAARHHIRLGAVVLAWLALGLWWRRPDLPGKAGALGLAALVLFGTGSLIHRAAPLPAVLLADCPAPGVDLPAGSEVWARPAPGGAWRVQAGPDEPICPGESIRLVVPRRGGGCS